MRQGARDGPERQEFVEDFWHCEFNANRVIFACMKKLTGLFFLVCFVLQAEPPAELAALNARYESSLEAVVKPVKERHLQDLRLLREQAVAKKDQALIAAINVELAAYSEGVKPSKFNSAADLTKFLEGTVWTWGPSIAKAESKIQFLKGGICIINKDEPVNWKAEDGQTLAIDVGGVLKFTEDYSRFEVKLRSGGTRAGKRLASMK
jgi:hypothetical protein